MKVTKEDIEILAGSAVVLLLLPFLISIILM